MAVLPIPKCTFQANRLDDNCGKAQRTPRGPDGPVKVPMRTPDCGGRTPKLCSRVLCRLWPIDVQPRRAHLFGELPDDTPALSAQLCTSLVQGPRNETSAWFGCPKLQNQRLYGSHTQVQWCGSFTRVVCRGCLLESSSWKRYGTCM